MARLSEEVGKLVLLPLVASLSTSSFIRRVTYVFS